MSKMAMVHEHGALYVCTIAACVLYCCKACAGHIAITTEVAKLTHLRRIVYILGLTFTEEVEALPRKGTRYQRGVTLYDAGHLVAHVEVHLGFLAPFGHALKQRNSQVSLIFYLTYYSLNLHTDRNAHSGHDAAEQSHPCKYIRWACCKCT